MEKYVERIDLAVKGFVALVIGIISTFVDIFGLMVVSLVGLMALDFLSGCGVSIVMGEGLRSGKGIKGLVKKALIFLLMCAIYVAEVSVLKSNGVVTNGIAAAFCVMELVSIIENVGKVMPLPNKLKKLITTLKNTVGETDEQQKK